MIKVSLQKYHLKNDPRQKKAALVRLLLPATEANILKYRDKLAAIARETYDCFILAPGDNVKADALTLKLLIAFYNTIPGKVGLLLNTAFQSIAAYMQLDALLPAESSPGAVIAKIETRKK